MLRPSAIIASMAGTPSGVAGIFTITLGRARRPWSWRTWATVPSVSAASSGDTSIETNPSAPPAASCAGRRMSAAVPTSAMSSSQPISSLARPCLASEWMTPSYSLPAEIAFSKIVGLEVTPRIPSSSIIRARSPPSSSDRRMLSYQGLWP